MKTAVENLEQAAVQQQCRSLRLPAVADQCAPLADVAAKQRQTYLRYLEALLAAELEERERNTITRRIPVLYLGMEQSLEVMQTRAVVIDNRPSSYLVYCDSRGATDSPRLQTRSVCRKLQIDSCPRTVAKQLQRRHGFVTS